MCVHGDVVYRCEATQVLNTRLYIQSKMAKESSSIMVKFDELE